MLVSGDPAGAARTLPLGLGNLAITSQFRSDYGILFAGLVIVTVPILIVYALLQKQLVKGITTGALKG
jgi:ABC-type glycerol-3-phosphate transport system permease component